MKNIRKALFAVVFTVVLALGAFTLAACQTTEEPPQPKADYTLTFMNGTVLYDTVTAEEGSEYASKMKDDPFRVNYVFDGWSLSSGGAVVELPAVMPSENRTYYAVFSARYNLKLNAGIGTIPADKVTMSVKEGEDIYGLISSVTPTVEDGDAKFDGWFLRGTELVTATSGHKMPGNNVEVVAKYKVDYKINIFMESDYDTGEYGNVASEIKSGTAYVGDKVTGLPQYPGYYYDSAKENEVLYSTLGKTLTQNTFNLYYKLTGYDVVFNANLPADIKVEGEMKPIPCGHGKSTLTPDCDFIVDGYRFLGWSTTADGEIEYYAGGYFSVERATTFYAHWVKGLTELAGLSSDRIYLIENHTSKVMVPYLERVGIEDDIAGEYNATTHVFTFKNANAQNPDSIVVRGIADVENQTFTYLNVNGNTVYKLQTMEGEVDETKTISLAEDGKAVYCDGTDTVNGNYSVGADGSMKFVGGDTEFSFRLIHNNVSGFTDFMIRSKEYGAWNNISQAGNVDVQYTLLLDGYGSATMRVSGLSSSLNSTVVSEFDGLYILSVGEDAYEGDAGTEVIVMISNGQDQRVFACLLMTGEYYAVSDEETVYTNVYLERFNLTLYDKKAAGETLDKDAADKIELSGYSVLPNSATYTYTDANGESKTVKGKYAYDATVGTLSIIPNNGDELKFEITTAKYGEDTVPLFEPTDIECGQYLVRNLDGVFGNRGIYVMYVYNNGKAAFAFLVPVQDSFYGNILYDYTRFVMGEYTVSIEGKDDEGNRDERGDVYEYTANINPVYANYIYNIYSGLFGRPLNIYQFGSFKFQFVYSAETGEILGVNTYVLGDFQAGNTLTYNGVEYTLDGFGNAVATVEGKEVSLNYSYDTDIGIGRLFLTPDASRPKETVLYIDAHNDGKFVEYETDVTVRNGGTSFVVIFFKDNTALLSLTYNSGMSSTFYAFSYGNVAWNEDGIHGEYVRDNSVFSDVYDALNIEYSKFKFSRVNVTVTDDNGEEKTYVRLYIYEVGNTAPNTDNKYVITDAAGSELTFGRDDNNATYIEKGVGEEGDKTYEGVYRYMGDNTIQLVYNQQYGITFKLTYNDDGVAVGFTKVGNEAGYYISSEDAKSYLHLTGIKAGEENGVYAATYTLYDAETEEYEDIEGTYAVNAEGLGYDFTYETGEVDEDNKPITKAFTFRCATDVTGIPFFRKYVMQLNTYVYYLSATYGQPAAVGTLTGGGYSDQVFTLFQTQYTGNMEFYDDAYVWIFTATDGSVFYFRITSIGVMLLDNSFLLETSGIFELSEPIDVKVPATEGTEATEDTPAKPAIPAHTAHTTKLEMSGMAFAYLHYDYTDADGKTEDMVVSGIYVQYATNGFVFIRLGGDDVEELQFRFRLMMYKNGETGEETFIAELANMDYFGTYTSEDLRLINLNGFDYAYYIDDYGRVYGGKFAILDEDEMLIEIEYVDYYTFQVHYVYARLDAENKSFVIVDAPEEQEPSAPETGEPEGGESGEETGND